MVWCPAGKEINSKVHFRKGKKTAEKDNKCNF
jgi:hypothetical protein